MGSALHWGGESVFQLDFLRSISRVLKALQRWGRSALLVGLVVVLNGSLGWAVVDAGSLRQLISHRGCLLRTPRSRLRRRGHLGKISHRKNYSPIFNILPNSPSPSKIAFVSVLLLFPSSAGRAGGKSSSSDIRFDAAGSLLMGA